MRIGGGACSPVPISESAGQAKGFADARVTAAVLRPRGAKAINWHLPNAAFSLVWRVQRVRALLLAAVHHAGSRNTEMSIFAPMPTAQTLPRLAMPG
jgi:hypothetical protein